MKKNYMNKNYIKYLSGIINEEQFYFEEEGGSADTKENFIELLKYSKLLVGIFNLHEDEIGLIYGSDVGFSAMQNYLGKNADIFHGKLDLLITDLITAMHHGIPALDRSADRSKLNFRPAGAWDVNALMPGMLGSLRSILKGGKNSPLVKAIDAGHEAASTDQNAKVSSMGNMFLHKISQLNDGISKATQEMARASI
jgi:hypothetical protein